ncbi:hypothetical protein CEP53_001860 [Fusarium sp. AF-6]|nr:hypothetical protein CEP53_001860 [Fusarium sp. AF-6]
MHPQSTWDQSLMNPIIDPMQLQLIQNQMLMDFAAQEMQPQSTRNQPPMNPPIDPAQFQVIQDQIPMDSAAEPTQPQLTRDQSPMNLTRKPECDQQLEQHKGLIRSEYLDHDLSVLAVLDKLKSQNITITKNRLEVQLKRWGFFKQIKKATWRYLDHNIRKRKNQNKESEVIFRGKRLKQENITRGTEDNHKPDTLTLIAQRLSSPPPPTQPYVHLGTPPPLPMEFEWPSSLPWQKFQNEFQISAGEFAQFDGARGILTTVLAQTKNHAFAQLQGLNSHSSISRLAANIGMVMPDGNREDLLYTIQDMQYNCTTGSVFHCLKIIIYHLSNNLLEFDTYEEWSLFVNGLINIGILGPRMNLRDLRDKYATIKAFMEKLFQQAIRWTCEETETQEQNLALIKWLISSGQDPNPAFWIPGADAPTTPLQEAAAIGFHELVKLLLAYGATDEYAGDYNTPAAVLVVYPTVSDDIKLRIVDAIFEGGSLASWETVLHKAIQQGNMNLVKRILGRGPDVTKAFTGNIPPVFKMNALSFAVMAGKDFVEVILDHARAQGNLNANLITPDVFIAAAVTGDAETIRHLHQIHPTGSCENQLRITPLRAAVSAGQQSTCEVLLELYGGLSPVLLFLAAYNGHENLLRFLLEKGIDVNAAIDWDNCGECARVSKLHVHRSKAGQFPTVLCILKSVSTSRSPSCSNCIAMLIEGGARLVGGEVYLFAKQLLTRPLQVALALGGSPDEQGPSGKSALQAALTGNYESHGLKFDSRRSKIAQVLLKSGAKLSGGEVVWAIRHLDVELLTLLASSIQSFQDTDGSGTSALEAAICSRDPNVLKQVLPSYTGHYDPGSLCAAVREQHRNLIDSLLTNRPRLAAYDVLEGTAVGLAAMFGDVNLLQKLLNRFHAVWKPNSAFLPPLEDRKRHNPPFWRRYASASPELCKTSPLSFAAFCTDPQGFSILLD